MWSTTTEHHLLSARSAGNKVESLLLIVELSLDVVDWCGANKVQLGLGEVDRSGAHGRGNEGELGVLVSLPLWGSLNLNLSFTSSSPASYEVEGIRGVDEVLLLPVEELLGVVDTLGGRGSNAGSQMCQLCSLESLPLRTPNYSNLGRGNGQTSK